MVHDKARRGDQQPRITPRPEIIGQTDNARAAAEVHHARHGGAMHIRIQKADAHAGLCGHRNGNVHCVGLPQYERMPRPRLRCERGMAGGATRGGRLADASLA